VATFLRELDESLMVLLGAVLTVVGAMGLQLLLRQVLGAMTERGHLTPALAKRLGSVSRLIFAAVVMLSVLQQTGLFSQAWAVVSAGLVAVAVGFVALWSVASNVVCSFMILAFRPFRMGDQIEIVEPSKPEPGIRGIVIDLNLMFTTLEEAETDDDRVLVRVPNSVFFLKSVRARHPRDGRPTETYFDDNRRPFATSKPEG